MEKKKFKYYFFLFKVNRVEKKHYRGEIIRILKDFYFSTYLYKHSNSINRN